MADVVITVDNLDVEVPEEWLLEENGGEEMAADRVRDLRKKFAEDQMNHGYDKAVEFHQERMPSK